jgi:hypothetical protein
MLVANLMLPVLIVGLAVALGAALALAPGREPCPRTARREVPAIWLD